MVRQHNFSELTFYGFYLFHIAGMKIIWGNASEIALNHVLNILISIMALDVLRLYLQIPLEFLQDPRPGINILLFFFNSNFIYLSFG